MGVISPGSFGDPDTICAGMAVMVRHWPVGQFLLYNLFVAHVVYRDLRVGGEFYGWDDAGRVSCTSSGCPEEDKLINLMVLECVSTCAMNKYIYWPPAAPSGRWISTYLVPNLWLSI